MKININKLFFDEPDETIFDKPIDSIPVDYEYLDKVTVRKIRASWDYSHRSSHDTNYINTVNFNRKADKFIDCNISELFNSLKEENKIYTRDLFDLIRDHIDITNVQGELVNRNGTQYRWCGNRYYIDENNIIHKYDRNKKKKDRNIQSSKLELIASRFWEEKENLKIRKLSLLSFGKLTNSTLNRLLKDDKNKLNAIEQEYNSLYNFIYNRDVRDKSDRNVKPLKVKQTSKQLKAKSQKPKNEIKVIVKPNNLLRKSIFNHLTGL